MANPQHDQHPQLTDRERQARLDDWLAMVKTGANLTEMGEKYGVTRQRVNQILQGAGIALGAQRAAEKAARRKAYRMAVVTCSLCGEQYVRDNYRDHYRGGSHRYLARASKRSPAEVARDAELAAAYQNGERVDFIAARLGVPVPRVYRALRWNGLGPSRRPTQRRTKAGVAQLKEWVIEAWRSDTLYNSEIADKFAISEAYVGLILDGAGLTLDRKQAQQKRMRVEAYKRDHGIPIPRNVALVARNQGR